ncbi:hypothetical protein DFA_01197 [Cavenderia fasciculata]|uniref:Fibronectin type-III domain-containing protein n=1 Tax=Cavenderia fasciculata TaxID=261658 RepID=F4PRB6_CACFS|nr:uncharacterized protein DFA_01197 [Cavenderia fasciculata]EGG21316.1 hypothetical protein DFA_01197 [Cavenderia fasciculata]|eukprot:XP_004359166.1 hypothetical protein DFA_01197 [Cavenderia fasciculata]
MGITSSTEQKDSQYANQQSTTGRGRSSSTNSSPMSTGLNTRQQQQQQPQQQTQYHHVPPPSPNTIGAGNNSRYSPIPSFTSSGSKQIQQNPIKSPNQQSQQQQQHPSSYTATTSTSKSQYSSSHTPSTNTTPNRFIPMGSTPATSEFNVLMSPPSSPLSGSIGIPNTQEVVPTVFTWAGGGKEVFIAGSFNNWKEKIPLSHSEKDFTLIYNLPPGVHQYKFIVDGKWVHSSEQPVAADTKGNLINFVEVKSKDISNELSNFKISSTPPGSYSKNVPEEEFQKIPPPSLPAHLRRALLNTQPSTEDPTLLPLPHHVMLNHLYSLPRKDKVTILGVTHRYKTKFVTTVLYKPVHEPTETEEPDDLELLRKEENRDLFRLVTDSKAQWIYEVEYAGAGCTGLINRVTAFYDGQCYAGGSDFWWYSTSGGTPTFRISSGGCFAAAQYTFPYTFNACNSGNMMVIARTVPPIPMTGALGFERISSPNPSADCLNFQNERNIDRIGACVMLPSNRGAGIYTKAIASPNIGFGFFYVNCPTIMGSTLFTSPMTCSSVDGGFTYGQVFPALSISSVAASNTLTDVSLNGFSSNIGGSTFFYTAMLSCPAGQFPMSVTINPATPTAAIAIPAATRGQSCVVVVSANGDPIMSGVGVSGQSAAFTIPLLASMSSLTPGTVTTRTISFSYSSSTGGTYTVTVGGNTYPGCSATTTCTATGLTPNTLYTVSVTVTNAGTTSAPLSYSATTVNVITTPSIAITGQTSTSISVSYPVTRGYGATTYQLRLNTVVQASCTTSSCTLSGLVYGTVYTISVTATNDGYSATSLDSVTNFWTLPTIGAVNILNYGTTWVSFGYSSNNGRVIGANTFAIRVNGVLSSNATCSSSTSCYVGGLTAGSTPSISILSTNNGETSATPGTASQKLYNSVNTLTVTPSLQTSSSFRVSYSSLEGIPGQTSYQILIDGASNPNCPTTTTQGGCTLTSMASKTYNATVTATNDGLVLVKTIMVLVTDFPTMNPIVLGAIGTTWVEFTYSSNGGTAGGNSYTVNVAGSDIATASCKQGPYCKVIGLAPGSSPAISIYVTNNGENSIPASKTATLYQPTSTPTITLTRVSTSTLSISWVEHNGVPGQSLFDVLVNGTNICTNIATTTCQYNSVVDGIYYNITTIVKNDNFVSSNSTTYFYPLAIMSSLTPGTVTTRTISFSYSSSTGGTYTVTVGGNTYTGCSATTTCTATGLTPNTLYTVSVLVTNAGTVSSPLTYSATTVNVITTPSIAITGQTSTSISVSYPVTRGYGATTYQLRLNTVVQASCTTSSCTLFGLVYGTVYTISVTATNDGYSATSLDSVTNFWTLPTMGAVNILNYGTTWVSFSYSSNNGRVIDDNTFAIRVNGVLSTNTTCSTSTNCYVGGLTAGSTPSISILSTNNGETSATPGTASQKLYNSVNTLTVTPSLQTSSSFRVSYSSLEGIPGQTSYLLLIDGVSNPNCPTTEGGCTLTSMIPKTYNATVTATNDGLVLVKTIMVLVTNFPTMNPIEIGAIGTTWVEFNYSSIGGTSGGNSYTINVAGSDIATASCKQGPYCKVIGLAPGSSPAISIYVTNNGEDSDTVSETPTLYQPTSTPTITLSRVSESVLNISWVEHNGVPGQSLFDVLVNGTNICTDIAVSNCLYNSVVDGEYFNITIIVKNDNFESSNSTIYYSHPPTTSVIVTAIGETQSIYINWTESSGGVPGETKYNVFMSVDNDHWANVCLGSLLNFSCLVDDLPDNTFYYVMVTVENTDFEVLQTVANATTLPFNGTNPCRSNTTSTVDCSGHGTCPNQECLCADGWDGRYCEVPTDGGGDGGGGVIITPNPSNPGIDIDKGGVKYSFTINKLLERDLDMNVTKVLHLTSLTWQPVQQLNTTLVHPTNNGSVIRRSWTYTAINATNYAAKINITFIQLEAIPNVTIGDSYPITFAGDQFHLKIGSFKYSMEMSKWNFGSLLSTLELWTSINAPVEECGGVNSPVEMVNGTKSNFINVGQANGKLLYGRLVNRVMLDSIPRAVGHYILQESPTNTSLVTAIPYFGNQVEIDPNFSMLLDTAKLSEQQDKCSKSDDPWRIIVGCVVGGAAVATAVTAGTLLYKRKLRIQKQETTLAKKLSAINNGR